MRIPRLHRGPASVRYWNATPTRPRFPHSLHLTSTVSFTAIAFPTSPADRRVAWISCAQRSFARGHHFPFADGLSASTAAPCFAASFASGFARSDMHRVVGGGAADPANLCPSDAFPGRTAISGAASGAADRENVGDGAAENGSKQNHADYIAHWRLGFYCTRAIEPGRRCPQRWTAKLVRNCWRACSAAMSWSAAPLKSIANRTGHTTIPATPAATF